MFSHDPRHTFGFNTGFFPQYPSTGYGMNFQPSFGHNPYYSAGWPVATSGLPFATTGLHANHPHPVGQHLGAIELQQILARVEEIKAQQICTNEILRNEMYRRAMTEAATSTLPRQAFGGAPGWQTGNTAYGAGIGQNGFNGGFNPFHQGYNETLPVRLRESDSHVYCDVFLPNLTVGDVEVDVTGNRITCRTRVPLAPNQRWAWNAITLPRGLDIYELPDGRIEYTWLCPVSFQAKEVEATFREGFLCICVPKSDAVSHRQPVKISKESVARRAASEMNS